MSYWTVLFFSVIPASGTRQIDKTFIKGLLTIQDQENFKTHNKRKLRQQYRKSRFSGDKTAPLAVSFPPRWMFSRISEVARIGNSFLVLLGCPFGRYDLGPTVTVIKAVFTWHFVVCGLQFPMKNVMLKVSIFQKNDCGFGNETPT